MIVTIENLSPDIFVVLRVTCVLRAGEEPCEPYFGSNKTVKTKEMAALVNKVSVCGAND
jgi:hypothetical protein